MSLLDGAPKTPLPSMSWDSVVEDGESEEGPTQSRDDPPPPPAPPVNDSPPVAPQPGAAPAAASPQPPLPPTFAPVMLESNRTSPSGLAAQPKPAPAPEASPTPASAAAPAAPTFSTPNFSVPAVNLSVPSPAPATAPEPSSLFAPDQAAARPVRLDEADFDLAAEPPARSASPVSARVAVPEPDGFRIVEATPIPELTDSQQAAVAHSNTGEMPATASPAVVPAVPAVPIVAPAPTMPVAPAQPSGFSLPRQPAVTPGGFGFDPLAVDISKQPSSRPRRQKKSGSGFGALLVLIILGALVAAGIVFGRPYLFPEEWDESSKTYADDIEAVRGVEFVEPLIVTAESTAAYRTRVGDQLLGSWEAQMPMWRSLGLAAGGTEREVLDSLIVDRSPAIYSAADGQVYHDAALSAVDLDPQVTLAMAMAALDQDFVFTQSAGARGLLDAATTEAQVRLQATDIQRRSSSSTALRVPDDSPLAFLPPVVDYQLVAPTVFTELLPGISDVGANPLDGIGRGGAGPLADATMTLASPAPIGQGETLVGDYRMVDRSFWYLAFATHLDPSSARLLSRELSAASIGELDIAGRTCFSSTFQTSTAEGLTILADDLSTWVGAAAPELEASAAFVDPITLELRTCDPGDVFTSNARFGVARDLIAWQAAELATISAVIDAGGDQMQVDLALGRLAESNAFDQVLALEVTASSTEVAEAARSAVASVATVPVAPVTEPAES